MKLENFYFIGWPAGRGGKIGKIGKNQAWSMFLVNRLTGRQGGQARQVMKAWLGKVEGQKIRQGGHEGMVRQGGRFFFGQAGKVIRLIRS
jgi:hypothetical protein